MKTAQLVVTALAISSFLPTVAAQEEFRRVSGDEIRSRIIGMDITDDVHWWTYFREDGALVAIELGRERVGHWTIEADRLCMAEESAADAECFRVWIREDEVILRLSDGSTGFIGSIRIHEGH